MQKNKLIKILTVVLGFITVVGFFWHVYQYKNDIFKKFDSNYWTKRYNQSQWVVSFSKNPIGDDGLYIYAGYRYIMGDDPSLLNAQLPPFGKYLVGLLEVSTGYIGIFSVVFSFLFLVSIFLLNRKIFQSSVIAMLSIAIFSFEPLFYSQIRAPYLDTAYASFLFFAFLMVLNKKYIISGILLGFFMSIKSPFLIVVVYAAIIVWLIARKNFDFRKILKMVFPTLIVFMLTYSSTFLHGHGLIYFLKVQKYILNFYSIGAKAVIGAVFPMIISGKWYTWFSPVQTVSEWNFLWPIALIGSFVSVYTWFRIRLPAVLLTLIWLMFYFIFLSFTPVFSRYLLLSMPFMYNLTIWSLYVPIRSKFSLGQ